MKLSFKFLQTGGMPLTNDLMALIEEAYGIFEVLGDLAGHLTILSGCVVNGSNVTPGIVSIDGKLYYFEGGLATATVFINTQEVPKVFQDQTSKTLIEIRTVRFGNSVAPNLYNWADFTRLKPLKEMQDYATQAQIAALQEQINLLAIKTAPIINGGIVWPWRKPAADIPAGWKECIDLRGKTIFGRDPNDTTFANLGNTIGTKTKTIAKVNLPAVGLSYEDVEPGTPDWMGGGFDGGNNKFTRRSKTTANMGSGTPMDVLNPGRIVNFIEPDLP